MHNHAADEAIVERVTAGRWPRIAPAAGRVIYARLSQTLTVMMANQLADPAGGIRMPEGLPDPVLAAALLFYWTYEMELPLSEPNCPEHGHGHGHA